MEKVTLSIDRDLWKQLSQLKLDLDIKTFDELIKHLIKRGKGGGK